MRAFFIPQESEGIPHMPRISTTSQIVLPDVYLLETENAPQISGVPVGVVGVVGTFQQGIPTAIYTITNYSSAVRRLGKSTADIGGPMALQNLIRQGAGDIRVVPVFGEGAAAATVTLYDDQATPGTLGTLTAAQMHPQRNAMVPLLGDGPNSWTVTVTQPSTPNGKFSLTIRAGSVTEQHPNLETETWVDTVNAASALVIAEAAEDPSTEAAAAGSFSFSGGASGALDTTDDLDTAIIGSVGEEGEATGIALFRTLAENEVNVIFAAEYSSEDVNAELADFANDNSAIALICAEAGQTVDQTLAAAEAISQDNVAFLDGWTTCYDGDLDTTRNCAPTALVAGMASRLGPQFSWGNKTIRDTLNLTVARTKSDMEELQQAGVMSLANKIPRGGFGTRNGIASDGSDLYVRRMRYFLEYSIEQHMGWAVEELQSTRPRDPLRQKVQQSIGTFLQGLAEPADQNLRAIDRFSVVCNSTNNPDSQVAQGRLSVDVAVRLLAAAKYIVISANISKTAITTTSTSQ